MRTVAGIDLGGTAINYTFLRSDGAFLIAGLFEHPARVTEGPSVCLGQIAEGLGLAAAHAGISVASIDAIGLDTPGPASATGVLSARGSTNFIHRDWPGFDIPAAVARTFGKPVTYLNDGNAAALWGHTHALGDRPGTSISAIIGTGLGGGIVVDGRVVSGSHGFGGEVGHVLIPYQSIVAAKDLAPVCNCGREGDLESLCSLTAIERSLLPHFLKRYPTHELAEQPIKKAAKLVRGMAERGDEMCRRIFEVQAHAMGLFLDEMINVFDPDIFIVGGGAIETSSEFQQWFLQQIRAAMPSQREEQASLPIRIMPNGDTASARGVAIEALRTLSVK
jgi:predicted NBD/HSP70 family sugar kinase